MGPPSTSVPGRLFAGPPHACGGSSATAADKWGKKRGILLLGAVFVAGSLVCACANSFPALLVGRALQGCLVGVVTMSYSLVRDIMPRDFVPLGLKPW
ncbi:MFS transporter [Streptomyces reniochalinae]|uniref:MFS transporter n=1 Tax=Streptomyces reniochalinae TaxID=2250578 RepID=UPI001FE567B9|nr:MFS transporter [Streptomyces reniochalinae]